jgi:hypothetical protein
MPPAPRSARRMIAWRPRSWLGYFACSAGYCRSADTRWGRQPSARGCSGRHSWNRTASTDWPARCNITALGGGPAGSAAPTTCGLTWLAFRGGLLAKAIIRSRPLPVWIGFSDQLGEFCYGIAFSVGSEFIGSHWIARIQFSTPLALTYWRSITRGGQPQLSIRWIMNLKYGVRCWRALARSRAAFSGPNHHSSPIAKDRRSHSPRCRPRVLIWVNGNAPRSLNVSSNVYC